MNGIEAAALAEATLGACLLIVVLGVVLWMVRVMGTMILVPLAGILILAIGPLMAFVVAFCGSVLYSWIGLALGIGLMVLLYDVGEFVRRTAKPKVEAAEAAE